MIGVDSSVLIAVLENEADAAFHARAMARDETLVISAVNVHETGMVLRARRGEAAARRMWTFLRDNDFEIAPLMRRRFVERSRPSLGAERASIPAPASTLPTAPPTRWP